MDYLKLFQTHEEYEAFVSGGTMVRPNVSHCVSENEVHYNAAPIINGHEYVDLGLPSGTLWATMNVGATAPEDGGFYFAWGETQGHIDVSTNSFSWDTYSFTNDGGATMTKYNATDGKTTLDSEDDAAAVSWGGGWHIPTISQIDELTANTTSTWDSTKSGYTFTSTNGKSIFIPAAGFCTNNEIKGIGTQGLYWSSSLWLTFGDAKYASCLWFISSNIEKGYCGRCSGILIRCVIG